MADREQRLLELIARVTEHRPIATDLPEEGADAPAELMRDAGFALEETD